MAIIFIFVLYNFFKNNIFLFFGSYTLELTNIGCSDLFRFPSNLLFLENFFDFFFSGLISLTALKISLSNNCHGPEKVKRILNKYNLSDYTLVCWF